jgi:3-hydroxyisobutyrate dehydrogenase-like beta-hydroxyacid dehydrogenase
LAEEKLEVQAKEKGAIYLATPVFGQPVAAKAKQLINLVSGAKEGREYVSPIFPAIGKKVIDVGEDVGKGESQSTTSLHPAGPLRVQEVGG